MIPLHQKFHKGKFAAFDEWEIKPTSEKELASSDAYYKTKVGSPESYYRPNEFDNTMVLYPRPTGIVWDDASLLLDDATDSFDDVLTTPNLVSNGSFETDNFALTWHAWQTPETFERTSAKSYSGGYSAHVVDSTPSQGGFENWIGIPTVAGRRYRISFYYYIVTGILDFVFNDGGYASLIDTANDLTTTGKWIHYTKVITASLTGVGGVGQLIFTNRSPAVFPAEFYIDDVSVQDATEGMMITYWDDAFDDSDTGIIFDTIDADDHLFMIFEAMPEAIEEESDTWDDEISWWPPYMIPMIEYATLERCFGADTDGFIPSLRDYWENRKKIGLETIKLFKMNRSTDRDYRLGGFQKVDRSGHPRLPSAYPTTWP